MAIPAREVTGNHIGDAPVLPDLLSRIPEEQEVGSITADGAYDTRKRHDAIADRDAHAVIPARLHARQGNRMCDVHARPGGGELAEGDGIGHLQFPSLSWPAGPAVVWSIGLGVLAGAAGRRKGQGNRTFTTAGNAIRERRGITGARRI